MKKFVATTLSLTMMLLASKAFAWQQVYDVNVTDYKVDYNRNICTFTIDRDHPTTTRTNGCNLRKFSWQCSEGDKDYRMAIAMQSYKNGAPIHLRYSEYACHSFTGDMALLSVWSGYHMCNQ
jgi:hypothetical protein